MATFSAICAILLVIWAAMGPERRSSHFELISPAGLEEDTLQILASRYSLGGSEDEEGGNDGITDALNDGTNGQLGNNEIHELQPLLPP
jgi:hypothetical protein